MNKVVIGADGSVVVVEDITPTPRTPLIEKPVLTIEQRRKNRLRALIRQKYTAEQEIECQRVGLLNKLYKEYADYKSYALECEAQANLEIN